MCVCLPETSNFSHQEFYSHKHCSGGCCKVVGEGFLQLGHLAGCHLLVSFLIRAQVFLAAAWVTALWLPAGVLEQEDVHRYLTLCFSRLL